MLLALPLITGCAAPVTGPQDGAVASETEAPRILVYTQTLGFRHDSIPAAVDTLRTLAGEAGFAVVHSEDPALFDDDTLAGFHAVVFANTTGNVLDATQRAALEHYVHGGGGFMGVHSAADTGHDWPWYGELVGAWFESHPPGLQTSPVRFESRPAPDGSDGWQITDELYNFNRNPRPHVDVLATVDERTYEGGTMGQDHPIAWCHARLGGRAWYTGLGHDIAVYDDPVFRTHLLQGLRYTTGTRDDC